jgi:hypothetical protein
MHQTLSKFSGYYHILTVNVLKNIQRDLTMRIVCQTIARVVNWVFPVHMSNSRLQIAPQRPEKIHGTWDSTHIRRNTLCLYFREDMQVQWTTFRRA